MSAGNEVWRSMDVTKWRIRKWDGKWQVYAPGWAFSPSFTGESHGHCVSALPYLIRIRANREKLRRSR